MQRTITSFFILLLCYSMPAIGQQTTTVLEKIQKHYTTLDTYNIDVTYAMYRGYAGNDLTESYTGRLYKDGAISNRNVLKTDVWMFSNAQITIDPTNKQVYYTAIKEGSIQNTPIDIKTFSQFYKEHAKEIKGTILRYEMVLRNPKIPSPYSKIVLYADAKTYQLVKQELFFANKMPFVDKEGNHTTDLGRLEIVFTESKKALQTPKLTDFITTNNNILQLTPRFKGYELTDQTKHTK